MRFPTCAKRPRPGFAAGLVASGRVAARDATRANKRLLVEAPGRHEVALVDVCVTRHLHVASRALWEADSLDELFVAFAEADSVGMSSIAGLLQPVPRSAPHGLHVKFANDGRAASRRITAPIAPGLLARIRWLPSRASGGERFGERRPRHGCPRWRARDRIRSGRSAFGRLDLEGPRTIDVALTMGMAAQTRIARHLRRNAGAEDAAFVGRVRHQHPALFPSSSCAGRAGLRHVAEADSRRSIL